MAVTTCVFWVQCAVVINYIINWGRGSSVSHLNLLFLMVLPP